MNQSERDNETLIAFLLAYAQELEPKDFRGLHDPDGLSEKPVVAKVHVNTYGTVES